MKRHIPGTISMFFLLISFIKIILFINLYLKMKNIKKTVLLLLAMGALFSCAKDYDDSELRGRIENLETWQKTVNDQINALQGLVSALENKDYVTSVTEFPDKSGYVIAFGKSSSITIKHGQKGEDGNIPAVGVKQDTDGKYYWTLDGEYITDGDNKIPATGDKGEAGSTPHIGTNGNWWIGTTDTGLKAQGTNGNDGVTPHIGTNGNWWIGTTDTGLKAQGTNGNDGVTPKIRINPTTNIWEISIDGGINYTPTGINATGDKGDTGAQGDAIFAEDGVDLTDPNNVTFTLADGITTITLPITSSVTVGFESYEIIDAISGIGCPDINVVMPAAETYTSIMAKIECNGGTSIDIKTRASGSAWSAEIIKEADNKVSIKVTPAVDAQDGDVAILTVSLVTKTGALVSASRTIKAIISPITPSGDTYTVNSLQQFGWLMNQMIINDFTKDKIFELATDIDLTGYHLKPIGAKNDGGYAVFKGVFDGKGHTIRGVDIKRNLNRHVGFFSVVETPGIVQNVNVEGNVVNDYSDGTISGGVYTGGIVGFNNGGSIANSSFKGSVNSYNIYHTGGIVGVNMNGLILGCRYLVSEGCCVRSNGTPRPGYSKGYTAGIVGYNYCSTANAYIIGCGNEGMVNGTERSGGIVAENFGSDSFTAIIVGCYNQGIVKSEDGGVAGIAGTIGYKTTIQACYNTGILSSADEENTDVCAIIGGNSFPNTTSSLNTNYWLTGSALKGYTNISEDKVVDCVEKPAIELNSQETVDALNAAIDVWNAANNDRCGYKFAVGDQYPKLINK